MKINETNFCYHCGVLTEQPRCVICGSYNSMRPLKLYMLGDSKIPDRLYHMKLSEIGNHPHISNFGVCPYCHVILKQGERCDCYKN